MITHTVSWLELVWTILAALGFVFQLALFHRTMVDLVVVEHYDGSNTARKYAAVTSVYIFAGGLLTQASYIIVGVVNMTQPNLHNKVTAANFINGTTFILASLSSVILAGVIYYRRVHIISMIEELETTNEIK